MPKDHVNTETTALDSHHDRHRAFIPLLITVFLIWVTYRFLFAFPIWFDELIGKAIFFGLPVWLYVVLAQSRVSLNSIDVKKFKPGIFLGLVIGGLYGLVGTLAITLGKVSFQTLDLFNSLQFWKEFVLAITTGFWESLFFFGWVYLIAQKRFPKWQDVQLIGFTSVVFVFFHVPNTLLRIPAEYVLPQLLLLAIFAIGQSLLFKYTKNVYALTLSHAFWGLVLLLYGN